MKSTTGIWSALAAASESAAAEAAREVLLALGVEDPDLVFSVAAEEADDLARAGIVIGSGMDAAENDGGSDDEEEKKGGADDDDDDDEREGKK